MDFKMRIPDSCKVRDRGYVILDEVNHKAYRSIPTDRHDFLFSEVYQNKVGTFWPKVTTTTASGELFPTDEQFKTVEVEYFDHVIYWPEMSSSDRKASLLLLCDISLYLAKHNMWMESHLWNVVLQYGKPILIDIGDFFEGEYIMPQTILDTIWIESKGPLGENQHCPVHPKTWIVNYSNICSELQEIHQFGYKNRLDYFQKVKECINKIEPINNNSEWEAYPLQNSIPTDITALGEFAKQPANRVALCEVIEEKAPATLVDLGCSRGLYSFFAAMHGATTVGIDCNHALIADANSKAAEFNLNCNFATIDLLNRNEWDSKGWGEDGHYGTCLERFKSEAVIVPSVLHHVHGKNKSLEQIITEWASLATKWIMLEYIPYELADPTKPPISLETITRVLGEKGFTSISFMDSPDRFTGKLDPKCPRQWVLAEKE